MQLIPLGLRRELSQKKKKWFDIKVLAKKRVTAHRREMYATGGGQTTTELSPLDNCIACIIGDTALSGITKDGDTDALATEQTGPSNTQSEATPVVPEEPGPSIAPSMRHAPRVLSEAVLKCLYDPLSCLNASGIRRWQGHCIGHRAVWSWGFLQRDALSDGQVV